jgi:hypothetical protein
MAGGCDHLTLSEENWSSQYQNLHAIFAGYADLVQPVFLTVSRCVSDVHFPRILRWMMSPDLLTCWWTLIR